MKTYTRNTAAPGPDSYLPNFGAVGTHRLLRHQAVGRLGAASAPAAAAPRPGPGLPGSRRRPRPGTRTRPTSRWLDGFAGKSKNIQNPNGSGLVRFGYVRSIAGDLGLAPADLAGGCLHRPTPTPTPDLVEVPDVRGATVSDATAMLEAADFKVGVQEQVYSDSVADGRVVDTDPSRLRDGSPAKYQRAGPSTCRSRRGRHPPAELTTLTADQGERHHPADGDALPVFTPNGDGTSDTLTLRYTSSVAATIRVTVTNSAGKVVRTFTVAGKVGSSTFAWNGKNDTGSTVARRHLCHRGARDGRQHPDHERQEPDRHQGARRPRTRCSTRRMATAWPTRRRSRSPCADGDPALADPGREGRCRPYRAWTLSGSPRAPPRGSGTGRTTRARSCPTGPTPRW